MFEPVPGKVDFIKQEHDILKFWSDDRTFDALRELRKDGPRWSFIDGPITANNPMGVHHGWGRTYKDLFHRFKSMQGHRTRYQNGFDCQGLWVEVEVEREKGFETKRDIEKFGLAEFVVLCKQRVLEFAAVQTEQSIRLGYWMDWDRPEELRNLGTRLGEDPMQMVSVDGPAGTVSGSAESIVGRLGSREMGGSYFTLSDANNYTIWAVLKSCYDRGWIYKGRDVMPWCGRCGTGLSQHEIVTEGYQELTHPSFTLRFPLVDRPGESLLVWTTTPWTLTSNVAAAVGPDLVYVRVRQGEEVFYLSKRTLGILKGEYEVESELTGSELDGWRYTGPFDELPAQVKSNAPEMHRVILWEDVGEEEGTGIVHIAPGAGAEDYQLGREHELPVIAPLNEAGIFMDGFAWLSGTPVAQSAHPIHDNLAEKELVYRFEDYTHRYPVCWRCGEELVFRLVDEWFISMGEQLDKPYSEVTEQEKAANLRYQMMEVVINETKWHPSFGLERELDWLRNMHDWMISKKRYWGLALPIYECEHCGNFEVIGSKDELEQRAIEGWSGFEGRSPHRPFIDKVQIACRHCGETAGVVGMSTLSYEDDREYWAEWFPADLISESFPGQFRNWFYSLLAMSTVLERRAPFRNVFSYATLLAEDGRAMHKSWGNSIEFNEAANKMGVDVMRWLYSDHQPEKDLLFGYQHADEVRRQFLLPLWNVYSFLVTYARIDDWRPRANGTTAYSRLDRWIQARLNELIERVTESLENYEPHNATASIKIFLDDLTNWYLRRSRRRFWAKAGASETSDADKEAAYQTLYGVLTELIRLLAPFVPFVTESIHQNLAPVDGPASIHHTDWPTVDKSMLDPKLSDEMALVKRMVSLGHAARNQAQIRLRQPLREAAFSVANASEREVVAAYSDIIREELNVKEVRLLDAVREAGEYQLKPLPKQLGQKHGAQYPAIQKAVLALEPEMAAQKFLNGESVELQVGGERLEVLPSEVEVQVSPREGFTTAAEGAYVAALVTDIDEELHLEGLANEVVRRVQELRKRAEFSVDDRIELQFKGTDNIVDAIEAHREHIAAETLSHTMERIEEPTGTANANFKFQQQELEIAISKYDDT
jgi:isoleucyl-tRNA synthetase